MRILLDTNIIIHREARTVVNEDIGILFNWLDTLGYEKCIHPSTIDEFARHDDPEVVRTMTIKAQNYQALRTISEEVEQIIALRANDRTVNDSVDTDLIKEVYNRRVDLLISEDRGVHAKARTLGIGEKVFTIDSFLQKVIVENPGLRDYEVLAAKKQYFGNVNLGDDFFNSFKEDYNGFEEWFQRKADDECYVCVSDDRVRAFLYVKIENQEENYGDINPNFAPKKRLKIGTFKVESTGYKLGERFLKIVFDNALLNRVDEIYVTIFNRRSEQERLILLLEDWGFVYWGEKITENGNELVYVRDFRPFVNIENPRLTYPFVSKSRPRFIVPIYPEYHTELFPDSILNNESPHDFMENEPYRNAIRKVYISRSVNRNLNPGDIILFYRTGGIHRSVISTIGVVEKAVHDIRDESHFIELCRKRSVFNDDELRAYWNYNPRSRPFIVYFLYIDSLPTPKVNYRRLNELGLLNEWPRGFEPLEQGTFERMLTEARANESYIID